MTSPVRLSRERWEMLTSRMDTDARGKPLVTVTLPIESGGIVFLPATYAPRGAYVTVTPREAVR